MPTIHIIVKGEVQGVFYRVNARKIAEENNIRGWVRNLENGDVEIKATGTKEQLNCFLDWCWKGPEKARVSFLDVKKTDDEDFEGFKIKRN